MEKAKTEKEAHGKFESECCGAQDTFYVGNMKGVGRIYQQIFIDTYSKMAFAKLYDRKTPITAANLLNDRVVPFFDEKEVKLSRVLIDRGIGCGVRRAPFADEAETAIERDVVLIAEDRNRQIDGRRRSLTIRACST